MVSLRDAANASFKFQKIFGEGSFLAAGQLLIPPEGSKPTKNTKDNSFVSNSVLCCWPLADVEVDILCH